VFRILSLRALLAMNIEGAYTHKGGILRKAKSHFSRSCNTEGQDENHIDEGNNRSFGEYQPTPKIESINHFLLKCRLAIMSDTFRAWKTLYCWNTRSIVNLYRLLQGRCTREAEQSLCPSLDGESDGTFRTHRYEAGRSVLAITRRGSGHFDSI